MSLDAIPYAVSIVLVASGAACSPIEAPPDESAAWESGPLKVEVTGEHYEWTFRYPGSDGVLGTVDDYERNTFHVPVGATTTIVLKSNDYIYAFGLPDFDVRQMAVPDLEFEMVFEAKAPGTFELRGNQMCGYRHAGLSGELTVETKAAFRAWEREGKD